MARITISETHTAVEFEASKPRVANLVIGGFAVAVGDRGAFFDQTTPAEIVCLRDDLSRLVESAPFRHWAENFTAKDGLPKRKKPGPRKKRGPRPTGTAAAGAPATDGPPSERMAQQEANYDEAHAQPAQPTPVVMGKPPRKRRQSKLAANPPAPTTPAETA